MAKKICEDWANLLMNERVHIRLEGEREQRFVDGILQDNSFLLMANRMQEHKAALGTAAYVPRVTDGRIRIGDNDLLKIHLLNAALKHEPQTDRVKLVKLSETAHVDGTAALLDIFIGIDKHYDEIGGQIENRGR